MDKAFIDLDEVLAIIEGKSDFINNIEIFDLISKYLCDFIVIGSGVSLLFGVPFATAATVATATVTYKSQEFSPLIKFIKDYKYKSKYSANTLAVETLLRYELAYKVLQVLAIRDTLRKILKTTEQVVDLYIVDVKTREAIDAYISENKKTIKNLYENLFVADFEDGNNTQFLFWEGMIDYYSGVLIHNENFSEVSLNELKKNLLRSCKERMTAYTLYLEEKNKGFNIWYRDFSDKHKNEISPIDFIDEYNLTCNMKREEKRAELGDRNIQELGIKDILQRFKVSDSWGNQLKKALDNLNSVITEASEVVKKENNEAYVCTKKICGLTRHINKSTYSEIHLQLKSQIDQFYKAMKSDDSKKSDFYIKVKEQIDKISEKILDKPFRRILLLTGDSGSGKTQQMMELIDIDAKSEYYLNPYYFFLDAKEYASFKRIEDWFLNCIKSYLKLIEKPNESIYNVYKNHRMFFIIENVEYLLQYDRDFIEKLCKYMESMTIYNNVYFCISISYYSIYRVLKNQNNYLRYVYDDSIDGIGIQGWIDLFRKNTEEEVGFKIISNENSKLLHESFEKHKKVINTDIYNPRFAWKIIESEDTFGDEILSLANIDFIRKYDIYLQEKFEETSGFNKEILNNFIGKIITFFIQEKTFILKEPALINYIIEKAKENKENFYYELSTENVKTIMENLKGLSILRISDLNRPDELVFSYDLLWSYYIAESIDLSKPSEEIMTRIREVLDIKNEGFNSKLIETTILLCNKVGTEKTAIKLVRKLFNEGFIEPLLVIGSRLTAASQKEIYKQLDDEDVIVSSVENLFAYIYFVANSDNEVYSFERKVSAILKYGKEIKTFELSHFANYEIEKLICSINEFPILTNAFKKMYRIDDEIIAERLGELCAKRFYHILAKLEPTASPERRISEVLNKTFSMINNNEHLQHIAASINKDTIRWKFFEEFLYHLFGILLSEFKFELHYSLLNTKWYEKELFNATKDLRGVIRRQITVNFGKYFRKNKSEQLILDEYCKMLESIMKKKNDDYYKLAFHFIINTEIEPKENPVHDSLRKYLSEIYNRLETKDFVKKRMDIFTINKIVKNVKQV